MGAKGGNDVATVHRWTGLEAAALRAALRMSVRSFAEHLGVAPRTVAKWEKYRVATEPYPDNQAILDTALARADPAVHMRFEVLLSEAGQATGQTLRVTAAGPRLWEYETWGEDLERCVVALNRQNFGFARSLLTRWSARWPVGELDDRGLYLLGRTTVLEADLYRDQGVLLGPMSAQNAYAKGRQIFTQLDIPRRIAQIELSQAVVAEMSGKLDAAAHRYEALAVDERLSRRDRARAQLWVGTALSKDGNQDYAARVMLAASRDFEDLSEPDDWSVAQQKLALAYRGSGDLTRALQFIETARMTGTTDTPMQRVRLDTAHGHILLSDQATVDDGLRVLDRAAGVAAQFGLSHQLRSIEGIRTSFGGVSSPRQR
jgi:transcriptional regulator with XRE-family HTH domain